jgi:hypothetical protein
MSNSEFHFAMDASFEKKMLECFNFKKDDSDIEVIEGSFSQLIPIVMRDEQQSIRDVSAKNSDCNYVTNKSGYSSKPTNISQLVNPENDEIRYSRRESNDCYVSNNPGYSSKPTNISQLVNPENNIVNYSIISPPPFNDFQSSIPVASTPALSPTASETSYNITVANEIEVKRNNDRRKIHEMAEVFYRELVEIIQNKSQPIKKVICRRKETIRKQIHQIRRCQERLQNLTMELEEEDNDIDRKFHDMDEFFTNIISAKWSQQ